MSVHQVPRSRRLTRHSNQLKTCQPPVGLIVCDEGHRLKSKDSKTTKMFDELNTGRRISAPSFAVLVAGLTT